MTSNDAERPPLFRRHVCRPRLTRILAASTSQTIVVNAPAGYGKTTLVAEWLDGRSDVAWYRATSASADVAAFSVGLAEALQPVAPGAGGRLRQRMQVTNAPEKAVRPLAELLAEDLLEWPRDAWLVIEDYHLVMDSAPVEEFLDWLLTLAPIRMLVTTRRRPRWASARRVLYGEVTEISREQLAMTDEEASAVLANPSSTAVAAVVDPADGWPAVIGLAAIAAASELPEARVSDALYRYLADEVLRQQPAYLQAFLLSISVPAVIDLWLVREITGDDESRTKLEALVELGLLERVDPGAWRFHPLLRDFLRSRLQLHQPHEFVRISTIALAHARTGRQWDEAFGIATAVSNIEAATEILGEATPALLREGRVQTVEKWLEMVDTGSVACPTASLAKIEVLTRHGKLMEARVVARQLVASLEQGSTSTSRALFLLGQAAHLASDYEEALARHHQAMDNATNEHDRLNALWGVFLAVAELEGQGLHKYVAEIERAAPRDVDGQLRVASARQIAAAHAGSFAGAWAELRPLLSVVDHATDPMAKTNFLAGAAYLNIGRADYELAAALSARALTACINLRLDFGIGYCLVLRGAAEAGLRRYAAARNTLVEAAEYATAHEDPHLRVEKEIVELKINLLTRTPHPYGELPDAVLPRVPHGEYVALRAMAAAIYGSPDESVTLVARAAQLTRTAQATFYGRLATGLVALFGRGTRPGPNSLGLLSTTQRRLIFSMPPSSRREHTHDCSSS